VRWSGETVAMLGGGQRTLSRDELLEGLSNKLKLD
jgi:hypothetical protein